MSEVTMESIAELARAVVNGKESVGVAIEIKMPAGVDMAPDSESLGDWDPAFALEVASSVSFAMEVPVAAGTPSSTVDGEPGFP